VRSSERTRFGDLSTREVPPDRPHGLMATESCTRTDCPDRARVARDAPIQIAKARDRQIGAAVNLVGRGIRTPGRDWPSGVLRPSLRNAAHSIRDARDGGGVERVACRFSD